MAEGFTALQTRTEKTHREKGKISACSSCDGQNLLAVDGEIVAQYAPAEAKHGDIDGEEPCTGEEEAVERQFLFVANDVFFGQPDSPCDEHCTYRYDESYPEEYHVAVYHVVQIDADGWSYCHGEVVAETIKSDAFVSPAGRQHVDGAGAVGYGDGSEGSAMQCSANGKHEDCACCYVSGKEDGKARKAQHEHFLARETVYHIAAKWAHDKGCHGVAAQYDAYGVFGGSKSFAQIEGQERGEEIEGEVQQKVCCHHLDVIGIPEFLFAVHCCYRLDFCSSSQASIICRAMESFSGMVGRLYLVNHLPRESSSFCRWISPST